MIQNEIDSPSRIFDYSMIQNYLIILNSTLILELSNFIAEYYILFKQFDDFL